jgi:hypothetical protein
MLTKVPVRSARRRVNELEAAGMTLGEIAKGLRCQP